MPGTTRAIAGCLGFLLAATCRLELGGGRLNDVLYAGAAPAAAVTPAGSASASAESARALLDTYCVTCHNERRRTAGLMLDTLDVEHVGKGAEIWEKVVQKLRTQAMPPPGLPRPDPASSGALTA